MRDDNKSLFLYTGLIFLVALIIILISLFGQTKFKSEKSLSASAPSGWGISEKAALISEENRQLIEKVSLLEDELARRDTQIGELTAENANQAELLKNYNIIMECYLLCGDRKYREARELLLSVNIEALPEKLKAVYDELVDKVS